MSVMETKLILYPESHKDIIKKVTEINEMLEIRNRWLTLSDRFWNWMVITFLIINIKMLTCNNILIFVFFHLICLIMALYTQILPCCWSFSLQIVHRKYLLVRIPVPQVSTYNLLLSFFRAYFRTCEERTHVNWSEV